MAYRVPLLCLLWIGSLGADDGGPAPEPARAEKSVVELTADWPQRLQGSDDPRVLLVAGLAAGKTPAGSAEADRLWRRARRIAPHDPVLLYTIASDCLEHTASRSCAQVDELLAALVEADPDNAQSWILPAIHALRANRLADAVRYLHQAGASSRYDSYLREYLAAYAEAISVVSGGGEDVDSWRDVVGLAAAVPDGGLRIARYCMDGIATPFDHAWQVGCLRLARTISGRPMALLDWSIALDLEERALQALHADPRELAELAERERAFREFKREALQISDAAFDERNCRRDANLKEFMRDWLALGEVEALRRLLNTNRAAADCPGTGTAPAF